MWSHLLEVLIMFKKSRDNECKAFIMIYVKKGQYSQDKVTPFCAMVFHSVMLLIIAIMQLSSQNLCDTSLESFFHGGSEYKGVELFRTHKPHKIASGVNFKQLQLFIRE